MEMEDWICINVWGQRIDVYIDIYECMWAEMEIEMAIHDIRSEDPVGNPGNGSILPRGIPTRGDGVHLSAWIKGWSGRAGLSAERRYSLCSWTNWTVFWIEVEVSSLVSATVCNDRGTSKVSFAIRWRRVCFYLGLCFYLGMRNCEYEVRRKGGNLERDCATGDPFLTKGAREHFWKPRERFFGYRIHDDAF